MCYTLKSVDKYEMWGPPDTIECIQYNGEKLESKYRFYCEKASDYARAEWMIHKLNKNSVKLEHLSVALEHLGVLYKDVQEQVEQHYHTKKKLLLEFYSKRIQMENEAAKAARKSRTRKGSRKEAKY